jgi:hypothetical protein
MRNDDSLSDGATGVFVPRRESLRSLLTDGQILRTQKARKKMQTAATSVTAGLLFPPERGEHGLAFQLRKDKSFFDA